MTITLRFRKENCSFPTVALNLSGLDLSQSHNVGPLQLTACKDEEVILFRLVAVSTEFHDFRDILLLKLLTPRD